MSMPKVLISGAGIAGSVAAWHLARIGYKVTVLERSKEMLAQGQNIDISGSAITILKQMNLLEEVRKYNTTEKGTIFLDRSGKPIASFPVKDNGPSPTAEFEILRGDLAMILYNATKDHPNVDYQFELTIDELIHNDDSSVQLKLSDGQVYHYDLAIAADGQWSKLRKLALAKEMINAVDRNLYCSYWTVPKQQDDTGFWYVYWGMQSRVISLRPDPHGTMRTAMTKVPLSDAERKEWEKVSRGDRKDAKEMVKKMFTGSGWQTQRFLDALDNCNDFYVHSLTQIKMQKWWTGSVICIGDAAYAPTPITGMGTTLAIMGGYLLAGELSKLQSGERPQTAFEAYDALFHDFTNKKQDLPSFVPGIAHPNSWWHLWALQTVIAIAARVLQLPGVTTLFGGGRGEASDDGFKLPHYPLQQRITQ